MHFNRDKNVFLPDTAKEYIFSKNKLFNDKR